MSKTIAGKYVPTYQEDYHKFHKYKRDMMSYIYHIKYKSMRDDPDTYFKNVKVCKL